MTIISNDPSWWPIINAYRLSSNFAVAAFVGLAYDWALMFGQEVELIWRRHWSLMTVLYLCVRYLGILYAVLAVLASVPTISLTDTGCFVINVALNWTSYLVFTMLWVIIITRLYAMYQPSRKILIFLIVIFLAFNIFDGVVVVMTTMHTSAEELILSGTYQCLIGSAEENQVLNYIPSILGFAWDVLALCHTVWMAVKHFHELRQHSAGRIVGNCFTMLIKTHIVYFASMVVVSCFTFIVTFSMDALSLESHIDAGLLQILEVLQMFVLGPRLILSIREYHAKLVADSDVATGVTTIAFQESMHISTGGSV
jgi:hypothetical protein